MTIDAVANLASEITTGTHRQDAARLNRLRLQLIPNWRASEWNEASATFTLDPDHPRSAITRCQVVGCEKTARSRHGLCATCRRTFEKSGEVDSAVWAQTAVRTAPQRVRLGAIPLCAITYEGVQCARPSAVRGLCTSHSNAEAAAARRGSPWKASARPYAAKPICDVLVCSRQSEARGLCRAHFARYTANVPDNRELWLAKQEPEGDGTVVWLGALNLLVQTEILFFLQQRDANGMRLDPEPVRAVARLARETDAASLLELAPTLTTSGKLWWERAVDALTVAYSDPTEHFHRDAWDLRVMGLAPREQGRSAITLSFESIRQDWLRDLAKLWITTGVVDRSDGMRMVVLAIALLSDAIAVGAGRDDRSKLSRLDILRTISLIKGLPYKEGHKGRLLGKLEQFLSHARLEGWLNAAPYGFAVTSVDRKTFKRPKKTEEEKFEDAVPEHIIQQLNAQIHLLKCGRGKGALNAELSTQLRRLLYVLLRDTGRRVSDLASLTYGCTERDGDGWVLVYDNVKARRLGRRLPIDEDTAVAIHKVEAMIVDAFPSTSKKLLRIFPRASGNHDGTKHVDPGYLSRWIADWVALIPSLVNDFPGSDGSVGQFDRSLIHAHAFRHSYAQRHADAGTSREILQELLDHQSSETTAGYYQITPAARRKAVEVVSAFRADRLGNPVGKTSALGYERQSVAAPYGNCQEPSNVAAGGQACPIRFQCAGCSHYRPDPSYLPAIETHIHELLQNREEAVASEAADWVVSSLESEVAAYRAIASKMKTDMSSLSDEERQAVELASEILRQARIMDGIPQSQSRAGPVPVTIRRGPPGDNLEPSK